MPEAQTQTPDQTPPPQAVAGNDGALNQGLSIGGDAASSIGLPQSFSSDVSKMQGIIGAPPTSAFQNLAKSQGDVLRAQQDQAKQEAQAVDEALTKYGSTADQALQRYSEQMAGSPLPAFVPTQETATDLASLGGMVAVLGFMVGRGKGMQPGLAALDSMTGMLKGWQQGRKELYDRERLQFRANFDRLKEAHEEYIQQLRQSLDVAKTDLQKGMADAKLAAVKAGDAVTAKQIDVLGSKAVIDAINAQNGVREKAVKIISDLDSKQLARMAQMGTPESTTQIAKAIANYQMPLPSGFALRSPFWTNVMSEVYQMNPDYSAVNYNKINKAITAFAVGKQGDIVRSLNVAAYHLQTFRDLAAALNNGNLRAFNALGQSYNRQTGLPAPTTFDAVKQIIGNEVLKATGGSIGGVTDRKDLQEDLDRANSPEQLLDVANKLTALIAGQFKGYKRQYEAATGLKFENSGLIDPNIASLYQEYIGGTSQHAGTDGVPELTQQQYDAAPSGTMYRVPGNPTVMVKP